MRVKKGGETGHQFLLYTQKKIRNVFQRLCSGVQVRTLAHFQNLFAFSPHPHRGRERDSLWWHILCTMIAPVSFSPRYVGASPEVSMP